MMNALDLTNAEYNEHRTVYITSIAGEIRSIRFLAPKIKKFMMNALELTKNTINIAETG
jgi:hypothetical protein